MCTLEKDISLSTNVYKHNVNIKINTKTKAYTPCFGSIKEKKDTYYMAKVRTAVQKKKEKLARKEFSKTQIFYFRISGVFR